MVVFHMISTAVQSHVVLVVVVVVRAYRLVLELPICFGLRPHCSDFPSHFLGLYVFFLRSNIFSMYCDHSRGDCANSIQFCSFEDGNFRLFLSVRA